MYAHMLLDKTVNDPGLFLSIYIPKDILPWLRPRPSHCNICSKVGVFESSKN